MDENELSTDLVIGIESVDKQHGNLFSSLYALHLRLFDNSEGEEPAQAFHRIVEQLEASFESVEKLWCDVEYHLAGEHAARHEEFSVELLKLDWDFQNGKAKVNDDALQRVVQMLGRHIVEWDKPLAELIIRKLGPQ